MKKLILLLALIMITSLSFGQRKYASDFEKSNVLTAFSAPGAYNDGLNIGFTYEYTNQWLYVGPEIYLFPELNHTGEQELPYYHLIGRFGLNKYFGQITQWSRIYAGARGGGILRDNTAQALLGLEAGFDIIISDTILMGASITSDMKTDSKVYSNDSHHTVNSVFVKLGFKF